MALGASVTAKETPAKKEFRVKHHPFTFKLAYTEIVADSSGVYTPKDTEEREYLEYQVKCGNISFS